MKSTSYLSSARTTSLLVLLLVYVSVDSSASFLGNSSALQASREALARAVELEQVTQAQVTGVTSIDTEPGRPCDNFAPPPTRVTVTRSDNRRWRVDAFPCGSAARDAAEPKATLQRIARELRVPVPATADVGDLFGEIEHRLVDERVNIASLGFALRGDLTPWVIGPIVIGLLALMRNGVRTVLRDPQLAIDEPWLLVDEGVGLERVVAGLWLAAIVAAPWVCGASIFAAFAWRVYADGSITTPLTDVTLVATAGAILLAGAWLGVTVASDLVALRAARRLAKEKAETVIPSSVSEA